MHTPQNDSDNIILNDTSAICRLLEGQAIEQRTKVLLPLPGANLEYIYDVALKNEHYEVCRTVKLILDLRLAQRKEGNI